jgi:hypothetical protein
MGRLVHDKYEYEGTEYEYYSLSDEGCGCCSNSVDYIIKDPRRRKNTLTESDLDAHIENCQAQLSLAYELREVMKNAKT